jgi:hypothetical protein
VAGLFSHPSKGKGGKRTNSPEGVFYKLLLLFELRKNPKEGGEGRQNKLPVEKTRKAQNTKSPAGFVNTSPPSLGRYTAQSEIFIFLPVQKGQK